MNKKDLVTVTADNAKVDVKLVDIVVDALFNVIVSTVKAGEKVDVKDFGSFTLRAKAARTARNPKTGAAVSVPAKNTVTFKPSKALLEVVKLDVH
jgi:DNA-binding protein HU-beta